MPVRGYVGRCGSGKTFTMQVHVARELARNRGWRFVVLDVNAEWPSAAAMGDVEWTRTRFPEEVDAALADDRDFIVVRPEDGDEDPGPVAWGPMADALAAACIKHKWTILCLPEIQQSAPEGRPMPRNVFSLATRYRHNKCGLWWDTQRLATVKKDAVDACVVLHLFAMPVGGVEGAKLNQLGGPQLVAAVDEAAELAVAGHKGWHVALPSIARPPFDIARSTPGSSIDDLRVRRRDGVNR